ncbi:MAG: SDR family oxidoreductase [Halioglobus sp.]|nr:SDR family oxidoreductase [Halioglobus sp.]
MSVDLTGRVYLVTGASRGFGLAIARCLLEGGARVGLVSRDRDALDAAAAELDAGDDVFAVTADVGVRKAVAQAFTQTAAHFGRFDGVVNNAGMARPNRIEHLDEQEVLTQINTNFLGTVFCCQAAIPLLRGGDNPRIVNISSASAWHYDEIVHLSIYAATKAAVERFTRDLRLELQPDNIGVTCVRPGGAFTSFADEWAPERFSAAIEGWKEVGTYMDMGMEAAHVGEAVRYAIAQPAGVAVDLLEVRPNRLTPKSIF